MLCIISGLSLSKCNLSLILFFLNCILMCKADLTAAPTQILEKVKGFKTDKRSKNTFQTITVIQHRKYF